jgi:hypothetical protein
VLLRCGEDEALRDYEFRAAFLKDFLAVANKLDAATR